MFDRNDIVPHVGHEGGSSLAMMVSVSHAGNCLFVGGRELPRLFWRHFEWFGPYGMLYLSQFIVITFNPARVLTFIHVPTLI